MSGNPKNQFDLVSTTNALRKIPNMYGRVRQSKLFTPRTVATTTVRLQEINGVLSLVPARDRGASGSLNNSATRKFHYLDIPHFPLTDQIESIGVQNSVDWNTGEMLDSVTESVGRKLIEHRNKLAITEEWLMSTALNGVIKNEDGTTLVDLYSEFGIVKKQVDFVFSVSTTNIVEAVLNVARHIEDNLLGDVTTGYHVLASPEWFSAFIAHKNVKEYYLNYQNTLLKTAVEGDIKNGFQFHNLFVEEYRGKASSTAGIQSFIPANKALAYPVGTMDTFEAWYAPPVLNGINNANLMATVGPYAMQTPDVKGRYIDLDSELNVLPLCKRPGVLVELTMS